MMTFCRLIRKNWQEDFFYAVKMSCTSARDFWLLLKMSCTLRQHFYSGRKRPAHCRRLSW